MVLRLRMVTTCLPRLWACWVWEQRAQTQQAQSLSRHVVTIPSLRTIPRALKLGKKNDLKKVLNWTKKGANLEASPVVVMQGPLVTHKVW